MQQDLNFIYICTDQLRADCVGYAKKYPVKTPNLDSLAADSVVFTESYCVLPTCCPARQSIISGKRPEKIGALWNYDAAYKVGSVDKNEYSWARELKANGYNTAYIGKWHVSDKYSPLDFGYSEYVSETDIFNEIRQIFPKFKNFGDWMGEVSQTPYEIAPTHMRVQKAISFLKKNTGRPFHLRLDFSEPHLPCMPSEPFASMYDPSEVPQWEGFNENFHNKPYIQRQMINNWSLSGKNWEDYAPTVAKYYAFITQVDDAIGMLTDYLKTNGLYEKTVIIFTSDHGDMCGSHHMMDKHYVMYDDIMRIPLLLKMPGTVPGKCDDYIINSLDIAPTVCEIFGLKGNAAFDGISLAPAAKKQSYDKRNCVMSSYNGQQFGLYTSRMLKCGNLKYIWNLTDIDELYDFSSDPGELTNLIYEPSYAEDISLLRKMLLNELQKASDPTINQWTILQLKDNNKF